MSKQFYTTKDVIAETGISPSTLGKWFAEGRYPAVQKVRNIWVIPASVYPDIVAYAKERAGNKCALHINKGFTAGSYPFERGRAARKERLRRNLREARERLARRRNGVGG